MLQLYYRASLSPPHINQHFFFLFLITTHITIIIIYPHNYRLSHLPFYYITTFKILTVCEVHWGITFHRRKDRVNIYISVRTVVHGNCAVHIIRRYKQIELKNYQEALDSFSDSWLLNISAILAWTHYGKLINRKYLVYNFPT